MIIYETPTPYERMINKTEIVTIVAKYEDKTTFDIQDFGKYLANLPCHEIPSQFTLSEREAHELLSDGILPVSCLLND